MGSTDNAILLATYNATEYLSELLESLFRQTCQEFTVYVHDDGSSDDTLKKIESFGEKHPNRIKILDGPVQGSAMANFLWMLKQVEAENYFFCDDDDVWLENKVEESLLALHQLQAENPQKPCCVFTDMYVVDAKLNILSESFIRYIGRLPQNTDYTQILIDNPAAGCTMCFNRALRDLVKKDYGFDMTKIPMHDSLILEIAAIFGDVKAIDRPLVYYRQTGENIMGATTENESEKLARNISDATTGGIIAKKKAFINEARAFAKEIIKVDNLPEEKKQILIEFAALESKNKISRMRFYRKHNFTRANHNWWMRLWV